MVLFVLHLVLNSYHECSRAKILTKLVETHRAGMHPVDFTPRNILVKDGDYRIVDLRDAISHRCTWKYDFIKHAGDEAPGPDTLDPCVDCFRIMNIAGGMRFWDYGELA